MKYKILVFSILILIIMTSCNIMSDEDVPLFVGWWDASGNTLILRDDGTAFTSEAPIDLYWNVDSSTNTLFLWSILDIFKMTSHYEFITNDTVEYTITDLSWLADSWYSIGRTYDLERITAY